MSASVSGGGMSVSVSDPRTHESGVAGVQEEVGEASRFASS